MPQSRKSQISLADTPFYHCISRCVRKSFLCGVDHATGESYEHRKDWVEQRLLFLASVFAIDICSYAVMSNHVHVILRVDQHSARQWDTKKTLIQWHKMHRGTLLTQKYLKGIELTDSEHKTVASTAKIYRERLQSISWFMRNLNEFIARKANKEDECTGRFWEGRFKSQALLDERALLACMAYVDLNPFRAGIATSLYDLSHTSVLVRLKAALNKGKKQQWKTKGLVKFKESEGIEGEKTIPFSFDSYLSLLKRNMEFITSSDTTHKKASLCHSGLPEQMGFRADTWDTACKTIETSFSFVIGSSESMLRFKKSTKRKRMVGMTPAKMLFDTAV
jgi:REP element-mobilizing transposase RayT